MQNETITVTIKKTDFIFLRLQSFAMCEAVQALCGLASERTSDVDTLNQIAKISLVATELKFEVERIIAEAKNEKN